MIGGEYFPNPGSTFFYCSDKMSAVHGEYRVAPREYRPGHFSGLAEMSGIFLREYAIRYPRKKHLAGTAAVIGRENKNGERMGIYGEKDLPRVQKNRQYCRRNRDRDV